MSHGMSHRSVIVLGIAVGALVASVLGRAAPLDQAAGQQPPAGTAAAAMPPSEDPDTGLFTQMCSRCHDAARITAMRRSTTEWEEVINKMIEKGATGTENDFEHVFNYLVRNYGKLHINLATAEEITTILGLSDKDAQGIVAYRKANGPFADFDAVKKVPEIDVKKLDDHKDAVAF